MITPIVVNTDDVVLDGCHPNTGNMNGRINNTMPIINTGCTDIYVCLGIYCPFFPKIILFDMF